MSANDQVTHIHESVIIPESQAGRRLDMALAQIFPEYSRSRLKLWIDQGKILLEGRQVKPREKVSGGEQVVIDARLEPHKTVEAEAIALNIIHEDEAILVINKPAGLVVHPAAGNWSGTLQNALLHHYPGLDALPRSGIVHRLDKDTTGLMVVARTLSAHTQLVNALQTHAVEREYQAVVQGVMTAGGIVDAAIGRHPVDRKRMAVVENGKPSVTHYRVLQRYRAHTHIRLNLETGRTHQIRVHMASLHYALTGDQVYGGRFRIPPEASPEFLQQLKAFRRQALHAARLSLTHPATGEQVGWSAALPEDFQSLLAALEKDRVDHEQA